MQLDKVVIIGKQSESHDYLEVTFIEFVKLMWKHIINCIESAVRENPNV